MQAGCLVSRLTDRYTDLRIARSIWNARPKGGLAVLSRSIITSLESKHFTFLSRKKQTAPILQTLATKTSFFSLPEPGEGTHQHKQRTRRTGIDGGHGTTLPLEDRPERESVAAAEDKTLQ